MRYLLDEDLHPGFAEVARGLGLDALSVHEVDRRGFSDDDQLRYAAAEGRCLVTRNRDDFIQLTVMYFEANRPHAGVLSVPRSLPNKRPEQMAHALKRWHEKRGEVASAYMIDFLAI